MKDATLEGETSAKKNKFEKHFCAQNRRDVSDRDGTHEVGPAFTVAF